MHARSWHTELWNREAAKLGATPVGKDVRAEPKQLMNDAPEPRFPKRAKVLKECLRELRWSQQTFKDHQGPDTKTTRKMLRGLSVGLGTVERAEDVFIRGNEKDCETSIRLNVQVENLRGAK